MSTSNKYPKKIYVNKTINNGFWYTSLKEMAEEEDWETWKGHKILVYELVETGTVVPKFDFIPDKKK